MQLHKVVRWMAQHNFPHGMVAFMDGVSADPLRQKTQYLKNLIKQVSSSRDLFKASGHNQSKL